MPDSQTAVPDQAPAAAPALPRCEFHRAIAVTATMADAIADVALFRLAGIAALYAHALSMGSARGPERSLLRPACCPAAAHARFLLASAFRTPPPAPWCARCGAPAVPACAQECAAPGRAELERLSAEWAAGREFPAEDHRTPIEALDAGLITLADFLALTTKAGAAFTGGAR